MHAYATCLVAQISGELGACLSSLLHIRGNIMACRCKISLELLPLSIRILLAYKLHDIRPPISSPSWVHRLPIELKKKYLLMNLPVCMLF